MTRDEIQKWRDMAEMARRLARGMSQPSVVRDLERIAGDYEERAERAEQAETESE